MYYTVLMFALNLSHLNKFYQPSYVVTETEAAVELTVFALPVLPPAFYCLPPAFGTDFC
jgi:hypothetical protein